MREEDRGTGWEMRDERKKKKKKKATGDLLAVSFPSLQYILNKTRWRRNRGRRSGMWS